MLKKTIKYTDYNGMERTEDFYFNLNKAEIIEMNMSISGGLIEKIERITQTQDGPELYKLFRDLVHKSYGVKSLDGKRIIKNEQILAEFIQTEAYSEFIYELVNNADAASEFVNGIVPKEARPSTAQLNAL